MDKERLEEIDKLKDIINSLDDSADADDFHKFVDTCQINYEEGVFNEILRFMQTQIEHAQELENELQLTEKALEGFEKSYEKEKQQNKQYRQAINFAIDHLKNSDIRQVQLIVIGLKSILEETK